MNQVKQNIMVVAILFFSLLSSVALSYVITPNSNAATEKQITHEHIEKKVKPLKMKQKLTILLPKVVK